MNMNDLKNRLLSDLCKNYEINQDEDVLFIKTPLHYDDGDNVVIIITPQPDNSFIVDDNGEWELTLIQNVATEIIEIAGSEIAVKAIYRKVK